LTSREVPCKMSTMKKMGQATVWLVESNSQPRRYHTVLRFHRRQGGSPVWSCDSWCDGFLNRGTCSHIKKAQADQ
jgi:hypothetical protein